MNKMLTSSKRYFWIVLIILLVACGTVPTPQSITPSPTSRPTSTPVLPTTTTSPTETLSPTPSSTPLPQFPLDGYVMLFTRDENLYFQDGNTSSIKLTHVGEKYYFPELSDDNQKVVFSRNDGNTYSINTDSSQEQIIIPKEKHLSVVSFIPGTHELFLQAVLCKSQKFGSLCSISVFFADADTGEIKKLADLGLSLQQDSTQRNVEISPDGKMVAVGTIDGMDVFTVDGKVIRHDILPYKPSTPTVLFPSLFWLPDSSGLIVAIPDTIYDSPGYGQFPGHTIWRYMIDDNVATQIQLDSPIPGNGNGDFDISPDGNWSIYGGLGESDSALYIGNLENGHAQIYSNNIQPSFSWGPDSKHFIYTSTNSFLGTLDEPPIFLGNCSFSKWIDTGHFTCIAQEENVLKFHMVEIGAGSVKIYDLGLDRDHEAHIFIKPK